MKFVVCIIQSSEDLKNQITLLRNRGFAPAVFNERYKQSTNDCFIIPVRGSNSEAIDKAERKAHELNKKHSIYYSPSILRYSFILNRMFMIELTIPSGAKNMAYARMLFVNKVRTEGYSYAEIADYLNISARNIRRINESFNEQIKICNELRTYHKYFNQIIAKCQ